MATTSTSTNVEVLPPTMGDAIDSTAYTKVETSFGTIAQLPLEIQVAFQQKVLAILAIQLFTVGVFAGVVEWEGSIENSIHEHILMSAFMVVLVIAAPIVLLALLHCVRNKYPLNWIMLVLFSCAQALGLLCVDVALDSHIAVVNCAFTWVVMLLMVALTRWTKPSTAENTGALRSPYSIGFIALAVTCIVTLIVDLAIASIFNNSYEIVISAFVQLGVILWFCSEVKAMRKKLSPDEYMRGVIYFYTDLLMVLVFAAASLVGNGDAALLVGSTGGSAQEEV